MITVGGFLAKRSRRVSPPRMPTSSSLTILMTCWAGFSAWETSAPQRPLLDLPDEGPDDGQRDVRLQQGDADLARRGVDVRLGQAALAPEVLERRGEAVGEGIEHGARGPQVSGAGRPGQSSRSTRVSGPPRRAAGPCARMRGARRPQLGPQDAGRSAQRLSTLARPRSRGLAPAGSGARRRRPVDVEGVHRVRAEGADVRAAHPYRRVLQRPADPVQQARGVLGADLDDRGERGSRRGDRHPRRRGLHPAAARVGGLPLGEPGRRCRGSRPGPGRGRRGAGRPAAGSRTRRPPASSAAATPPRCPPSSLGSSTARRSAARTVSRCRASTPAAAGSTPGWSGSGDEQFDTDRFRFAVGSPAARLGLGVQGEYGSAGAQRLDGEPFLLGAGRGGLRLRRGVPGEDGGDPLDQVGHERGAPGATRRRARWPARRPR